MTDSERYDDMRDKIIELQNTINRLQAENEVYETCNARKDEAIKSLESRLKKLQIQFDDISKLYNEIKAEAYKECVEDIKTYYKENRFAYDAECLCEELNNFLKETVGEYK